ncbi:MAG TPA: ATP-binding protein [Acidimicrobiales bacterium]|nr:ATP-binding protein [Acidimicrobiales bacterium]
MGEPPSHASLVLAGLPGAILAVDLDDRVTTWNRDAERLFGWRADEVVGRPLPIVPPDGVRSGQWWMLGPIGGEGLEVTTQGVHRDGRRIDVVLRGGAIRDEAGVLVGTAVLCRDARPQLRAASTLARSQAELALVRRLASLAQRLLQDLDLSGVLQALVEVALDLLATDSGVLSLEWTPGHYRRVTNVNIPADLEHHPIEHGVGLHGMVLDRGEPVVVDDYDLWEEAVVDFRRRSFHAALAVPITREERVIGVLSVHAADPARRFDPEEIDVLVLLAEYAAIAIGNAHTYRRMSAERARFHALVEAMPAGLAVVEDGVVTAWNDGAVALTGWSADAVLGHAPPLDLAAAQRGLEVADPEGRTRFLEAVRSVLPDGGGDLYLIHDQTEQRDLERAKDLLFATTSHELKTPLTVVKGLATTLLRHWDRMEPERRIEALATIERRAENLDRLIERILVGSRVQADAFDIVATPVEVGRLITDIVEGFGAAAGPAHRLEADLPTDGVAMPLVAGDRQVIDTVLGHLLENAIKYSPNGGRVTVRATADPPAGVVRIEVLDEGVGFEGDVERLLRPFVQADGATTRRFGGVGLGLYIVRQLVHALDGELSAANRPEGGAVFSFTIPMWT